MSTAGGGGGCQQQGGVGGVNSRRGVGVSTAGGGWGCQQQGGVGCQQQEGVGGVNSRRGVGSDTAGGGGGCQQQEGGGVRGGRERLHSKRESGPDFNAFLMFFCTNRSGHLILRWLKKKDRQVLDGWTEMIFGQIIHCWMEP